MSNVFTQRKQAMTNRTNADIQGVSVQALEYKEGQEAWAEGINHSNNPYKFPGEQADADKYDAWSAGWFDADEVKED